MVGESAKRLKFLKEIIETVPFQDMEPDLVFSDGVQKFKMNKGDEAFLFFMTEDCQERSIGYESERDRTFEVTVYDVWNCKVIEQFESKGQWRDFDMPGMLAVKIVEKQE